MLIIGFFSALWRLKGRGNPNWKLKEKWRLIRVFTEVNSHRLSICID